MHSIMMKEQLVKTRSLSELNALLGNELVIQNTEHHSPKLPLQNAILSSLPEDELNQFLPHLELVHLPYKEELHEYDGKVKYVYFLTSAVVSMLYVMAEGEMTEVAVIGREGVVGISHIMGETALCSAVVHTEGYGYKLKADVLKDAFSKGGELQRLLLRYMQALFFQISINSVSSRHYSIEQQVCLWLLDRLDRLPSNEIKVTHELIANMLGIRRESVTEATRRLHGEGLIDTARGHIKVINRRGLEMLSSECYYTAKKQYDLVCAN